MAAHSAKRSRTALSPTSRMTDTEPSFLEMRNSLLHSVEEGMGEKVSMIVSLVFLR